MVQYNMTMFILSHNLHNVLNKHHLLHSYTFIVLHTYTFKSKYYKSSLQNWSNYWGKDHCQLT